MNVFAILATAATALSGRWLTRAHSGLSRYVGLWFVIAFSIGCVTVNTAFLWPRRHWHCLPLTVVLAFGCESLLTNVSSRIGPVGVAATFSLVAAWLLVPTWESLTPSYPVCVVMFAAYMFVGLILWRWLVKRIDSFHTHLVIMSLMLIAVSIAVSAHVSVSFGQLSVVAAVALATSAWRLRPNPQSDEEPSMAMAPFVVMVGVAWMGLIDPDPPWWQIALLPAGPLVCSVVAVLFWPVPPPTGAAVGAKRQRIRPFLIAVNLIVLTATVAYILGLGGEAPTLEEW